MTLTGDGRRRRHGVIRVLERRAKAARRVATDQLLDERAVAALRGKATAYDEAVMLLRQLDRRDHIRGRRWGL